MFKVASRMEWKEKQREHPSIHQSIYLPIHPSIHTNTHTDTDPNTYPPALPVFGSQSRLGEVLQAGAWWGLNHSPPVVSEYVLQYNFTACSAW